jgi:hypothetical protein
MADVPHLITPIPAQIINEGANFGPLNLNDYISAPLDARFIAELADGRPLSQGLICTSGGMVTGIPAPGTQGNYSVLVTVETENASPFNTTFELTIKERYNFTERSDELTQRKNKVWQSLLSGISFPDIADLINMPVTKEDVQYLLERYGSFTMWDVFNLDPPGIKHQLELPMQNPHYNIYDCGSCIVGAPKELYSDERTFEDAVQTVRAMARVVHERGWTVELGGTRRLMRAAWLEFQQLDEFSDKKIHVVSYQPTERDVKVLEMVLEAQKRRDIGSKPAS